MNFTHTEEPPHFTEWEKMGDLLREQIRKRKQYSDEMLKIAILRSFIIEKWPRGRLFWQAIHDIKNEFCGELRGRLALHGHIVTHKSFKAFLWRGEHILTWDESTFTAYDDPQFKLPEAGAIYPVDNWSV